MSSWIEERSLWRVELVFGELCELIEQAGKEMNELRERGMLGGSLWSEILGGDFSIRVEETSPDRHARAE